MRTRAALAVMSTLSLAVMSLGAAPAHAVASCLGQAATVVGTSAGETIDGTTGDDVIVGLGGNDTINAGDGNDVICGGGGRDKMNGANGSDRLDGGPRADVFNGGAGFDYADYSNRTLSVTVKIDKVASDGEALEDDKVTKSIETVVGGSGNDILTGNPAANTLIGGAGKDLLNGGDGDDTLQGGIGADRLNGDSGDDLLVGGTANDKLDGGGFDDVVSQFSFTTVTSTDSPTAITDDGANNDFFVDLPAGEIRDINVRVDIDHASPGDLDLQLRSPSNVFMTLASGLTNNGTKLAGTTFDSEAFRNVTAAGTKSFAGRFHPVGSLDLKYRGTEAGGTWRLRIVDGTPGTVGTLNSWSIDVAYATSATDGADTIAGGEGIHDLVDYSARNTDVDVRLNDVANDGAPGESDDARSDLEEVITGSGNDTVETTDQKNEIRTWTGNDDITALGLHDEVKGQEGNDTIRGGKGGDDLDGDGGDDTLLGGEGNDNLDGGDGTDTLNGGLGTDTCTNGETLIDC